MNSTERLQSWYARQCDGTWEHSESIAIASLDNPGWSFAVSLRGTALEGVPFETVSRGLEEGSGDWITCWVQSDRFEGRGGAGNLEEMIAVFLSWAGA